MKLSEVLALLIITVPPIYGAFFVLPGYLGPWITPYTMPMIFGLCILMFLLLQLSWIAVILFIEKKVIPAIYECVVYDILYNIYPFAQSAPVTSTYAFTHWSIDECSICLESWNRNESITVLQCNHIYHTSCFNGLERAQQTQYLNCPHCHNYGPYWPYYGSSVHRILNEVNVGDQQNMDDNHPFDNQATEFKPEQYYSFDEDKYCSMEDSFDVQMN